jgi:hypothetical protein
MARRRILDTHPDPTKNTSAAHTPIHTLLLFKIGKQLAYIQLCDQLEHPTAQPHLFTKDTASCAGRNADPRRRREGDSSAALSSHSSSSPRLPPQELPGSSVTHDWAELVRNGGPMRARADTG